MDQNVGGPIIGDIMVENICKEAHKFAKMGLNVIISKITKQLVGFI